MLNHTRPSIPLNRVASFLRGNAARISFGFCLIYSSAAIFKKAGYAALLVYCVVAVAALWWATARFFPWLRARRVRLWAYVLAAAALFVGVLCLYLYAHPRIDTAGFRIGAVVVGASDNDDAIDVAIDELRAGRYPYYARTFLGGPLSPLPGALLLALPFYLVGDSALQNVFWTAVFFWFVQRHTRSLRVAVELAVLVLLLSPNVLYQIAQGIDYGANSIYVFIFAALLVMNVRRGGGVSGRAVLYAVLLGIGLSSRLNFLLIVPFVFVALLRAASWKSAIVLSAVVLIAFVAIIAPFYVYDPAGFSPLHTFNKIGGAASGNGLFRWAPVFVPIIGGLLAGALVLRSRASYDLNAMARDMAVVTAFLAIAGFVTSSVARNHLHFDSLHFGMLFVFFGAFGFGPELLATTQASQFPNAKH
jgi:hypothetical protein